MRRKNAFTLIELLTVVAILALLIAIILPSLGKARSQTKRTACAAHLRQVGIGLLAYLQDNRDRMPHISYMPSYGPAPLTTDEPIYLADVLKRQLNKQEEVLKCPEDRPNKTERPAPNTGKSFFESERSSYEYRVRLRGLSPKEFYKAIGPPWRENTEPVSPNTVWIARDYDNFHLKSFKRPEGPRFIDPEQQKIPVGARRYVYFDGHVTDFEN
jgi:prepilin-type N-terminal cleavage/methylation domain-containing protein